MSPSLRGRYFRKPFMNPMSVRRFNPFYVLSVAVGVLFLITATAYGVMAFRGASPELMDASTRSPIMDFLSKHGAMMFLIELALLMVTTVAAIATDEFWTGQNARLAEQKETQEMTGGDDSANPQDEVADEKATGDTSN